MNANNLKNTIASNTIPNTNITVNVNSDNTIDTINNNIAKSNVFNNGTTDFISAVYDSTNNKVIIAYSDDSNNSYGTVIVGTVSGDSISFGFPIVFNEDKTDWISVVYDTCKNKVVIAYSRNNIDYYGATIVGTVSGNDITFGVPVIFSNTNTDFITTVYDSVNSKIIIAYRDDDNNGYGTAIVGTIVDNTILFETPIVFNSNDTWYISTAYDSINNKVFIAYCNNNTSNYSSKVIIGTVIGSNISFGSPIVFSNNTTWSISIVYNSISNKIIIAYRDNTNNGYGTAIVGDVFGDSILFGLPVIFNNASTSYISSVYDANNNRIIIAYRNNGSNDYGVTIVGTVSDTNILFESPVIFNNAYTSNISSVYDANNNKVIIAYRIDSNNGRGAAIVFEPNTNS